MLNREANPAVDASIAAVPGTSNSLLATARLVRSYARELVAWMVLCLVLAVAYLLWAPSEYTASSQIILQPRRPTVVTQSSDNQIPQTLDTPQIDSQIEVIGSQRVLQPVFDALDLAHNPEFNKPQTGILHSLKSLVVGQQPEGVPTYLELAERVGARRVGQSLVLTISVRASSPELSARLANSVTASFLREEIEAKLSDVERSGDWLQSRIEDIRAQLKAATEAMTTGSPTMGPFSASDARILTTAAPPASRSSPKPTLTLALAVALSLGSGLAYIALRKGFDQRVWSVDQAMAMTGLNCIAVLPAPALAKSPHARLTAAIDQPSTDFARQLRVLRDTVLRHANRGGLVLGLLSARRGAGASIVTANLAHAIARTGTRCVLVDGDLQQAHLTKALHASGDATLLGRLRRPEATGDLENVAENLRFLPARHLDEEPPADLYLGSPRLGQVLRDIDPEAIVIVDLPALDMGADAPSLSSHLDGVILLVREGHATTEELWHGMAALGGTQTPLFGLVYSTDARF